MSRKLINLPQGLGSRPYRLGQRLAEALEEVLHDLDGPQRETVMEGFRGYLIPRCNPGCPRCGECPIKWYQTDTLLQQILGLKEDANDYPSYPEYLYPFTGKGGH